MEREGVGERVEGEREGTGGAREGEEREEGEEEDEEEEEEEVRERGETERVEERAEGGGLPGSWRRLRIAASKCTGNSTPAAELEKQVRRESSKFSFSSSQEYAGGRFFVKCLMRYVLFLKVKERGGGVPSGTIPSTIKHVPLGPVPQTMEISVAWSELK